MVVLKGGAYLSDDGKFVDGDIFIKNGSIKALGTFPVSIEVCKSIDIRGKRVIPGLVDIHMHGAIGYDVITAIPEQIREVAVFLGKMGTTSFLSGIVTADMEEMKAALRHVREASEKRVSGASIVGVHIEGPYINPRYKGALDPDHIKLPEIKEYEEFKSIANGIPMHITIAPEVKNAIGFIKYVRNDGNTLGLGHSDGNYAEVMKGVEAGASTFTHLFNAMKGIHHREPGVVGTALLSNLYVELICDGIHVNPEVVNLTYKVKGRDGIILVTDSMPAAGLGNGEYFFAGFNINVVEGIARKDDGTLSGSTLTLFQAVKNMMKYTGICLEDAVRMASINPAKALNIDSMTGSIQVGKKADLVVIDDHMEIDTVFCRGIRVS